MTFDPAAASLVERLYGAKRPCYCHEGREDKEEQEEQGGKEEDQEEEMRLL